MKKTAIAIAAHPDDIEFLMAGTLIALAESGYETHYWNLSNGCCGSAEYDAATTIKTRRQEAQEAAKCLGAIFHESICDDLTIFYERESLAKVASVIREVEPEIVLTHSPVDYMEDHTNTCRLATTAAFSRGMPNFPVDPPRQAIEGKTTVYHAQPYSNRDPMRRLVTPDIYIDVTDVEEKKVESLAKHRSQKEWLDQSQGLDAYLETLRGLDQQVGAMSQTFKYAEGWRRRLHLGFCDANDDPLAMALQSRIQFDTRAGEGEIS